MRNFLTRRLVSDVLDAVSLLAKAHASGENPIPGEPLDQLITLLAERGHVIGEPVLMAPHRPDVAAAVRADWRYGYLSVNDRNDVNTWAADTATCIARTESSLTKVGSRGGAGVWLDNDSLLAIRHVLEVARGAANG